MKHISKVEDHNVECIVCGTRSEYPLRTIPEWYNYQRFIEERKENFEFMRRAPAPMKYGSPLMLPPSSEEIESRLTYIKAVDNIKKNFENESCFGDTILLLGLKDANAVLARGDYKLKHVLAEDRYVLQRIQFPEEST